jgi:hypothetical protein
MGRRIECHLSQEFLGLDFCRAISDLHFVHLNIVNFLTSFRLLFDTICGFLNALNFNILRWNIDF